MLSVVISTSSTSLMFHRNDNKNIESLDLSSFVKSITGEIILAVSKPPVLASGYLKIITTTL